MQIKAQHRRNGQIPRKVLSPRTEQEIENMNRSIISSEIESVINSQKTKVQDQMASQVNSTKNSANSYHLFFS